MSSEERGHAHLFNFVDDKLREADFFFEKFASPAEDVEARRFYVSAFASASRSVTLALQFALSGTAGFAEWWPPRQDKLAADSAARFFARLRVECIHRGTNPTIAFAGVGDLEPGLFAVHWYADGEHTPPESLEVDLITAARQYMTCLAEVLFEAYRDFGYVIDPHMAWTPEGAAKAGITIEEIEEYVWGGPLPRDLPLEERFQHARQTEPQPRIDDLFLKWLRHDRFGAGRSGPA